jgi:tetratricopeptide (TPR) repeat protein
MKFNNPLHELYSNFRHIRRDDVYAQIRFYERHADALSYLNSAEHFTVCCYYANALFAAEDFERYLLIAPEILERSIVDNIQFVDGVDVYMDHLEKMSIAYLKLKQYETAVKICVQLYNISGRAKKYKILLKRMLKSQRPKIILDLFAISICLALFWTSCEIGSLLVFEAFYTQAATFIDMLQSLLLYTLLGSLSVALLGHYFYVGRRLRKLINKVQ